MFHVVLNFGTGLMALVIILKMVLPLRISVWIKILLSFILAVFSQRVLLNALFSPFFDFTQIPYLRQVLAGSCQTFIFIAFFLIVFSDIAIFLYTKAAALKPFKGKLPTAFLSQKSFPVFKITCIFLFTVTFTAAGIYNGRKVPDIKEVRIESKLLPQDWKPLKIALLSDLHIGSSFGKKWLTRVVEKTNAAKPDIVVIAGDLTDGTVNELADEIMPLKSLRAPLGVWIAFGNHDYFRDAVNWEAFYEENGLPVLNRKSVRLRLDSMFNLGGTTGRTKKPDIDSIFQWGEEKAPKILISHYPQAFDKAAENKVALQLSGHTHGGQVGFPFDLWARATNDGYLRGLYKKGDSWMYLSSGTGLWGGLPVRLFTTPEITLITLERKK